MPTYEYVCKSCGEHLEVVQSFQDAALTTCPACGGDLRKVFGNVGIVFKGSGFYKTDSRSTSTASAGHSKPASEASSSSDKDTAGSSPSDTSTKGDSSAKTAGGSSGPGSSSAPATTAASG